VEYVERIYSTRRKIVGIRFQPSKKVHLVDITIGSLDEESLAQVDLVKPSMHLWWKDGIGWVKDMFDSESGKGTFGELRKYITGDRGINAEEV